LTHLGLCSSFDQSATFLSKAIEEFPTSTSASIYAERLTTVPQICAGPGTPHLAFEIWDLRAYRPQTI
jgi:hypothetical protein